MVKKIILALVIGGVFITAYKEYQKSKNAVKPNLK